MANDSFTDMEQEIKEIKQLNKEQKPWAVVQYTDDGVDYMFFDTFEAADTYHDGLVAEMCNDAEVVDCHSAARKQAISWMVNNYKEGDNLGTLYCGFIENGFPVFELTGSDAAYCLEVAEKAIKRRKEEPKEKVVEVDEDEYGQRLRVATDVLLSLLDDMDEEAIVKMAKQLEREGRAKNLVRESVHETTVYTTKLSAALARKLCEEVLDTFDA